MKIRKDKSKKGVGEVEGITEEFRSDKEYVTVEVPAMARVRIIFRDTRSGTWVLRHGSLLKWWSAYSGKNPYKPGIDEEE